MISSTHLFAVIFVVVNVKAKLRSFEFHCPGDPCGGPTACHYPYPPDCSKFIQCDDFGHWHIMPCSPGTLWNDWIKVCDFPMDVQCIPFGTTTVTTTQTPTNYTTYPSTITSSTTTPTTKIPSTKTTTTITATIAKTPPTTKLPSTTSKSTISQSTTIQPFTPQAKTTISIIKTRPPFPPDFVCPVNDIINNECKDDNDCLYTNTYNCATYIQCKVNSDSSIGTPILKECPDGLLWRDETKACDYSFLSDCKEDTNPYIPTSTLSTTHTIISSTEEQTLTETMTTLLPTTTTEITTPSNCEEENSDDSDLDLTSLCSGCTSRYTVAHSSNLQKYIDCNVGDTNVNVIRKCSPGLLYSKNALSCDYNGLVNVKM